MKIGEMIDAVRVRALQEAVVAIDRSGLQPSSYLHRTYYVGRFGFGWPTHS